MVYIVKMEFIGLHNFFYRKVLIHLMVASVYIININLIKTV